MQSTKIMFICVQLFMLVKYISATGYCHSEVQWFVLCNIFVWFCSCVQLWKKSGAWFYGSIPPHADVVDPVHNLHESTRPLTPQNSPAPARKQTPVLKPTTTKDEPDVCSLGFGKEVQIHVMKCKPGMEALCYVYVYLFCQIKTEKKQIIFRRQSLGQGSSAQ